MASLSQVGLNPAGDAFTNGGGVPSSGGGFPAPSGGGGGVPLTSNRHGLANNFVSQYEGPFGQKLAQISQLAKTDPEGARAQLIDAWSDYLGGIDTYSKHPVGWKIAQQSLSNSGLMQTVDALWNETGGPSTGVKSLTQIPGAGGSMVPLTIGAISLGVQLIGMARNKQPKPAAQPGGSSTGNPGAAPSNPGGTEPGTPPAGTVEPPQGPTQSGAGGFSFENFLKQYAPYLLTAGSVIGNILGANAASNSAEKAAQIQAEASNKATALQKGVYQQNRADMYPWLERQTQALYTLGDMVGLKPGPRYMPTVNAQYLDDPNAVPPGTPAVQPPQLANTGQQPVNLDQLAAKYRRTA